MNPFADLPPPPTNTDKTFNQWSALGYRIRYGEKATGRNGDGIPTFNDSQVEFHDDEGDDDIDIAYRGMPALPLNRF